MSTVDEGAKYLYKNITLQTHQSWTKRKPNQNNGQKINNSQHAVERGSKTRMVHKSAFLDEKQEIKNNKEYNSSDLLVVFCTIN